MPSLSSYIQASPAKTWVCSRVLGVGSGLPRCTCFLSAATLGFLGRREGGRGRSQL